MIEKTVIIHDHRVYDELKRLSKTSKRLTLLALAMGVYVFALAKAQSELTKKVKEITKEGE